METEDWIAENSNIYLHFYLFHIVQVNGQCEKVDPTKIFELLILVKN